MPKKKPSKAGSEWTVTSYGNKPVTPELKKLSNSVGWVAAAHKIDRRSNSPSPASSRSSTPHSHKHGLLKKSGHSSTPSKTGKKRGRPPTADSKNKFRMVLEKDEDYYVDYESPEEYYETTEQESEEKEDSLKFSEDEDNRSNSSVEDMDFLSAVPRYDDLSEDEEDVPVLELPPSALDLLIPSNTVMDALAVYEVLRHFRSSLRLSPVLFEDFCAAIAEEDTNVLTTEIHIALMKALFKEEEVSNIIYGPPDQKDAYNGMFQFIDYLTWPEVLRSYLESSPEYDQALVIVANNKFPNVSVADKIKVLGTLTNAFLSSNRIRDELMSDGTIQYDDHCRACHKLGDLLCCETCPAVYHLACCNPPLREVPEEEWQCEVCVAHKLTGVYDCEHDMDGPYLRHEPIGVDRHGRKYWFLARRLIVEGENNEVHYYSTIEQLEYLRSKLDSDKYEMVLTEGLIEVMEEFPRHGHITEELTLDAAPNENRTYLLALKERVTNMIKKDEEDKRKKQEEEKKKKAEEEKKQEEEIKRKEEEKKREEEKKDEEEKKKEMENTNDETPKITEIKKEKKDDTEKMEVDEDNKETKNVETTPTASKSEENKNESEETNKEMKTEKKVETSVEDVKEANIKKEAVVKTEMEVSKTIENLQSEEDDGKEDEVIDTKEEVSDELTGNQPVAISNKKQVTSPVIVKPVPLKPLAKIQSVPPIVTSTLPSTGASGTTSSQPVKLPGLQVLRIGAGIQIRNSNSQSSGAVLKTLFVLNKDGTKTQLTLGTPAGKVAPQAAKQLTNQRPVVLLNSSQILQPKAASKNAVRKIQQLSNIQRIVGAPKSTSQITTPLKQQQAPPSQQPIKEQVKEPPKPLTHEEEAKEYFRLGEDRAYRQYQNQYVENTLALNKHQLKEERDRERYVGYKFSNTGPGEFKWIGELVGKKEIQIQTIRSTLLHFEHQLPQCFLHSRWEKYRNAWGKIVLKCDQPQGFAAALGILEMATRNIIKKSVWHDQLGQTRFIKVLNSEKDDYERKRKLKWKMEEDEAMKNAVWCKYPIPVRSMLVWKMKGEEYRSSGYGGWMWMSSTYKPRHRHAKPKPFSYHEVAKEDEEVEDKEGENKEVVGENKIKDGDGSEKLEDGADKTTKNENTINGEDKAVVATNSNISDKPKQIMEPSSEREKMDVAEATLESPQEEGKQTNEAKKTENVDAEIKCNENGTETKKDESQTDKKDDTIVKNEQQSTDTAEKTDIKSINNVNDEKPPPSVSSIDVIKPPIPPVITAEIINVSENLLKRDSGVYPKRWSASKVDILLGWRMFQNKSQMKLPMTPKPSIPMRGEIKQAMTPPQKKIVTKIMPQDDDKEPVVDVEANEEVQNKKEEKVIENDKKLENHIKDESIAKESPPPLKALCQNAVDEKKKKIVENGIKEDETMDVDVTGVKKDDLPLPCGNSKENEEAKTVEKSNVSSELKTAKSSDDVKIGENVETKKENVDLLETVTTSKSDLGEVTTTVTKVITTTTTIISKTVTTETSSTTPSSSVAYSAHRKRVGVTRMSKIRRDLHKNSRSGHVSSTVTQRVWKLKRYKKTDSKGKKDATPAMQLPLPWKFASKARKKKSIFRLPPEHIRKLALQGGLLPTAIGYNYNTKGVGVFDFFWPYPCPRPTFSMVWRYRLQNTRNLASAAHLIRVLWHCIKWDEITTKPATDDCIDTVTTDEHIITTELLKRKEVGTSGLRMDYFIRRITLSLDEHEEDVGFKGDLYSPATTPSQRGVRSSRRQMNLRERTVKQPKGPQVEHLWVNEDKISLWQIRHFDGVLKLQQRKTIIPPTTPISNQNRAPTFTAKIDSSLQRAALTAANRDLGRFGGKPSQPQQVITTMDPKTLSMITSNLAKGHGAKVVIQQQGSKIIPQTVKSQVATSQIIRAGSGGAQYILQDGKLVKPIFVKQTAPGHVTKAPVPAAPLQSPPAGTIQKPNVQTQIKLSQAQLSQLLKAGVGTPVKVNVNLSGGKQGLGQIQLIPSGMHVNLVPGQQLMQAKVGGEIRKFIFTHSVASTQASRADNRAGRSEVALQSSTTLQHRLAQIQRMQSGNKTQITTSNTKRLLTDKDPLWGSRTTPAVVDPQQLNISTPTYTPPSKTQMRRRLTNRAEREEFHRKNAVAVVMKTMLDRIEKNEEVESRKRKREENAKKQRMKKEKTDSQAKVRYKQAHMLHRYKDSLKHDILKRRAIVEKYLTISAKNDLHADVRKQKRKSDASFVVSPGSSKKAKKGQSSGIVTAAAAAYLTETTNKKKSPSKPQKPTTTQHKSAEKKKRLSTNEKLYCICKTPYDSAKFYIGCDLCMNWYHGTCVGIQESRAKTMDEWVCSECRRVQSNPNQELYCVCRTPYDDSKFYIGCDVCQDWYHGACVGVTEDESSHIESYICPRCQEKQSNDGVLTRDDYTLLANIIKILKNHKMSWPFLKPVDPKDLPNYHKVIKNPMDFSTVSRRLEKREYQRLSGLVSDVSLIFDNCRQYNGSDSAIAKCAEIVESLFVGKIREYRNKKNKQRKR